MNSLAANRDSVMRGSKDPLSQSISIAAAAKALLLHVQGAESPDLDAPENEFLGDSIWIASVGIPPMLLALSLELALKAWIVFENRKLDIPKTHDLSKLFSALTQSTQDRLRSRFRNETFASGRGSFFMQYELDDLLEHSRHAFVEWRYLHEMEQGSFSDSEFVEIIELVLSEFEKNIFVRKIEPPRGTRI